MMDGNIAPIVTIGQSENMLRFIEIKGKAWNIHILVKNDFFAFKSRLRRQKRNRGLAQKWVNPLFV